MIGDRCGSQELPPTSEKDLRLDRSTEPARRRTNDASKAGSMERVNTPVRDIPLPSIGVRGTHGQSVDGLSRSKQAPRQSILADALKDAVLNLVGITEVGFRGNSQG